MITVATPVEYYGCNPGIFGAFSENFADNLCRVLFIFIAKLFRHFFINGRGRNQCLAVYVINHLRENVFEAAIDVQAWTLCRALHFGADAAVAAVARSSLFL